jgi:hypothetical protein
MGSHHDLRWIDQPVARQASNEQRKEIAATIVHMLRRSHLKLTRKQIEEAIRISVGSAMNGIARK